MGGENLQKYFCRPLPSAAGPGYYYEIYVGGNNRARALVPGERYATLDQGSALCLIGEKKNTGALSGKINIMHLHTCITEAAMV